MVDVVLHVGSGKTGTSTIQSLSRRRNRDRLRAAGVLYPATPGEARHGRLGLSVRSDAELAASPHWGRQPWSDPTQFRKDFRRDLTAEIAEAGAPTVLFSDEGLFAATSDAGLTRLRQLLDDLARSVRVVVYLRRQDDHLVSRYQQLVETGEVRRLAAWATDDFYEHLRLHDAALRRHERLLAPDALVVRRFEPGRFDDGPSCRTSSTRPGRPPGPTTWTRSLAATRASTRSQWSSCGWSTCTGCRPRARWSGWWTTAGSCAGSSRGAPVRRSRCPRASSTASWPAGTAPTRAVARRWFGDGDLFTVPRRTEGTTTVQRLDPERLDRFLALDHVPEPWHDPLRRIAEQEAG